MFIGKDRYPKRAARLMVVAVAHIAEVKVRHVAPRCKLGLEVMSVGCVHVYCLPCTLVLVQDSDKTQTVDWSHFIEQLRFALCSFPAIVAECFLAYWRYPCTASFTIVERDIAVSVYRPH